MRIFPIPARGIKELIVSYSQELAKSDHPYRLPLAGLPKMDNLDVQILVQTARAANTGASIAGAQRHSQETVGLQKRNFVPTEDLTIALHEEGRIRPAGLRHENLVVSRIVPLSLDDKSGAKTSKPIESLLVLLDTSASRALGFATYVDRFSALVSTLQRHGDFQLQVVAFDQTIEPLFRGRASQWGPDHVRALIDRRAEGASDLHGALQALRKRYAGKMKFDRILLVGDGVATAGDTEGTSLRKAAASLAALGVQRMDVLAAPGIRDEAVLKQLIASGLPQAGVLLSPQQDIKDSARRMNLPTRSGIKISVKNANWVWPLTLDGAQPGDEYLVYADVPAHQAVQIAANGVGMLSPYQTLLQVPRPLLQRAWVNARLQRLAHQRDTLGAQDVDLKEALKTQMIALSTRHRVLCDYTALLVLETEADYARFHIDRNALRAIGSISASRS